MTARIARGGGRPAPRGRGSGRGGQRSVSTRRAKAPGLFEGVGLAPDTGRRIGNWILAFLVMVTVATAILAFRLPQLAGLAIGEGIGRAGFTLKRVEITGAGRVSRLDIYNVAFDQESMAMPLIDLAATRQRLLQFGWIREAQVSRRLPDTLVVRVIERVPAAIWQNQGRLSLIDGEGVVLEPVRIEAMPDLPLLIGPAANEHVAALAALLDNAPRLRAQIVGATWVGGRRWDLKFQSGEELALPEGGPAAIRALRRFDMLDQQDPLLGRGFARVDMRDPRRMYIRISREPGARVPPTTPPPAPDAGHPPADLSRTI